MFYYSCMLIEYSPVFIDKLIIAGNISLMGNTDLISDNDMFELSSNH